MPLGHFKVIKERKAFLFLACFAVPACVTDVTCQAELQKGLPGMICVRRAAAQASASPWPQMTSAQLDQLVPACSEVEFLFSI